MTMSPFYTITQISTIIGYSRHGTRKFVKKLNIPLHYVGNKIILYISDMATHAPELYNSILQLNQLNTEASISIDLEPDSYHPNQFR